MVARAGLEPAAVFEPTAVVLTAHFPIKFNDFGAPPVDFLQMAPETPPLTSGCP